MHPWVGLIIAHAHSYQPSEGPQTPSLYVCGYLLIFVYLSDFSNRHRWPDILSIDPEWFQPLWHRQIIYQSIYTVWRFLFLFFFFNDSLSLLSHEDTYVKLSSLCLSLTLFKSMTQKDTKFSICQTSTHSPSKHISRLKRYVHRSSASFGGIGLPLDHILKRPRSLSSLPAHV